MSSGRKTKYATPEERAAAMKAYQAEYRALRKSGKWQRKTNIHSPRIAAKYGLEPVKAQPPSDPTPPKPTPPDPTPVKASVPQVRVITPEERKARAKEKQHKYWHDHYSAIRQARRLAAMTPEQRAARDRRIASGEKRSLAGVIREIVGSLAAECGVTPDAMTERLLAVGGVDFLMRALEPRMVERNYNRDVLVRTALEGARFILDRDHAVIAWTRQPKPHAKRENVV